MAAVHLSGSYTHVRTHVWLAVDLYCDVIWHVLLLLQDDDWRHREWLCQLCGFLLYENIYISIGFLCCISLDRYLAVVHPLR